MVNHGELRDWATEKRTAEELQTRVEALVADVLAFSEAAPANRVYMARAVHRLELVISGLGYVVALANRELAKRG